MMVPAAVPAAGLAPEPEPEPGLDADADAGMPLPPAHPAVPNKIKAIPSDDSFRPAFMAHHPEPIMGQLAMERAHFIVRLPGDN
ncbi:hypothetical protein NicSoilB8_21370 [Arthrobacter sp. NicSoilB8]|nr:hypothetical protein NicSoilB8_21370 [Arthrobacter sp. NicSoilB8]